MVMNFSSQSEDLLRYWSNIPNCVLNLVVYVTNYAIRRTENGVTKLKGKLLIITRGRKIIKGPKEKNLGRTFIRANWDQGFQHLPPKINGRYSGGLAGNSDIK
jgi:hypothetical protein